MNDSVAGPSDLASAGLVAHGLEAGVRARAPGVYASTPTVRELAVRVSRNLGLDESAQILADVCARVRDVGMIALRDSVVLRTGSLAPEDWEELNRHPVLGAGMLETLPVLAIAAPIVRAHHERWDGAGYPDGLRGEKIPLLSRVIATCDAFAAMATDRPHRRGVGAEGALEQIVQERGSQFDPQTVDALLAVITGQDAADAGREKAERGRARPPARRAAGGRADTPDLRTAIAEFDVVPAFGPACERTLAAISTGPTVGGDAVAAIESDTGLTIAVLRRAQGLAGRRPIANISDAVAALRPVEIRDAVSALPRATFPWQTALEALMHHSRIHSQAVARAADRIARELHLADSDEILLVALVHDVGKLVLSRARPDYDRATEPRSYTPEQRIRQEQHTLGTDHASLGGLLLGRWKLPARLADAVAAHHSATVENEIATYVRLADMVAHHAQGDAVDRRVMLSLAQVCGLPVKALRDVLFDLPHSGGSQRRRAEPSPLSQRETEVLRLLGEGKQYKQIAGELGLSSSTVRSHLHNTYEKLEVSDRAQAVLRATEMAWI